MSTGTSHITQEAFDRELYNQTDQMTVEELYAVPGVYEVLAEELNNSVLASLLNGEEAT
jgi:hypothetical protein